MAMKLKQQGGGGVAKARNRFVQNIIVFALILAVIVTIIATNYISSEALRNTVKIAVLKEDLPKDAQLAIGGTSGKNSVEDWFEPREMHVVEYQTMHIRQRSDGTQVREVVLWEDAPRLVAGGAYASVYITAGRPVYYADFTNTGTQKNSYLYTMDGELLKLDIVPDQFGDMVVPGDKINIRLTYEKPVYELPTDEQYERMVQEGKSIGGSITVTETIFSEVSILDMLNSSGESIFDLYYEILTFPEARRSAIINSADFKARTKPGQLLLSVTAEEAERYAYIKSMGGEYMITLLPRDGTTEILDALDELRVGFARD